MDGPRNDNARWQAGAGEADNGSKDSPNPTPLTADDAIAFYAIAWAFSGHRSMPARQHHQVQAAIQEARTQGRDGRQHFSHQRLGPSWARFTRNVPEAA